MSGPAVWLIAIQDTNTCLFLLLLFPILCSTVTLKKRKTGKDAPIAVQDHKTCGQNSCPEKAQLLQLPGKITVSNGSFLLILNFYQNTPLPATHNDLFFSTSQQTSCLSRLCGDPSSSFHSALFTSASPHFPWHTDNTLKSSLFAQISTYKKKLHSKGTLAR